MSSNSSKPSPSAKLTPEQNTFARRVGLQIVFAWDATGNPDEETALNIALSHQGGDADSRQHALTLARGTWAQKEQIDGQLERLAPQWPPRRQPAVDRAVLRLATWEIQNLRTPPKVVIDEAIELVKEFSTADSAKFVNGVLDSVLKEHRALGTYDGPAATTPPV
jgi:N utilization substance protein B